MHLGLTDIVALLGALTGTAGLVLGILNHLRDRPEAEVTLQWDMSVMESPIYDPNKLWGIVRVTNIGRRPIFVSHASIKVPKGHKYTHLLIRDAVSGQKLAEGDPPKIYIVTQEGMEKYRKDWRKIRAVVFDSAGKTYSSRKIDKCPSWAE